MLVYYINLALILGLAWPLCIKNPSLQKKALYLLITFGYMWFLATFRFGIGYDYYRYIEYYGQIKEAGSIAEMMSVGFEPGYVFLTKLLAIIDVSAVGMYGVYTALILLPVVYFIFKYCDDAWLSTWIYVTITFLYTGMNFVRQSLACSISILAYGFLHKKKFIPFVLIILLAASVHKTALIMIPLGFLSHIKLDKKMGIFYGAATVLVYLTSDLIMDIVVDNFFPGYKDTIYVTESFHPIFLVIPFVFFGAVLALGPVWKKRDPDAVMLTNIVMFSAIIWLFITKHFIIERFSHYTYVLSIVAIPSAIRCLKASPETLEQYEILSAEADDAGHANHKKNGKMPKEKQAKLRMLKQNITDHKHYYQAAVIALLILTMAYHEFGAYINGFHNVFPYNSVLEWVNMLP